MHVDVDVQTVASASLLDLLAQILKLGAHQVVAGHPQRLHPVMSFLFSVGAEALVQSIFELCWGEKWSIIAEKVLLLV